MLHTHIHKHIYTPIVTIIVIIITVRNSYLKKREEMYANEFIEEYASLRNNYCE